MYRNTVCLEDIDRTKAQVSRKSAHTIYYNCLDNRSGKPISTIVKLNKTPGHSGEEHSLLEVIASDLTRFYMGSSLTSSQDLILDSEKKHITGVTVQDFRHQIQDEMRKTNQKVYAVKDLTQAKGHQILSPAQWTSPLKRAQETVSGYAFLDEQPQNAFDTLLALHDEGRIKLDMNSLACIFSASYIFEEDDLHKGNMGYYVTRESPSATPQVHFFKIDHDLMFSNSIMAYRGSVRSANMTYNARSFKITRRDLQNFPDLQDSGNHYWPTRKRFMVSGDKAYYRANEREAFAKLKDYPEFTEAKWAYFLKYALLKNNAIDRILQHRLDPQKARVPYTMIKTALNERGAELVRELFSTPGFKAFLQDLKPESPVLKKIILDDERACFELNPHMNVRDLKRRKSELMDAFFSLKNRLAPGMSTNALNIAINLGDYDFKKPHYTLEECQQGADCSHARFMSMHQELRRNKRGGLASKNRLSPLGCETYKQACITLDLLNRIPASQWTREDTQIKKSAEKYKVFFLNPQKIVTFENYHAAVMRIRQSSLPLEQQKQEALHCLQLAVHFTNPKELTTLENALSFRQLNPDFQFIRQLRSEWWITRIFRHAYGYTKTARGMLALARERKNENTLLNAIQYVAEDIIDRLKGPSFFKAHRMQEADEQSRPGSSPSPDRS